MCLKEIWKDKIPIVMGLIFAVSMPQIVVAEGPSATTGQVSLSGWLSVIIGDPPPGHGRGPSIIYTLSDDEGGSAQLLISEELAGHLGGLWALNGKRVKVVAVPSSNPAGPARVLSIGLDLINENGGRKP